MLPFLKLQVNPMYERPPKGGWKVKVHSFSKAIVYFDDAAKNSRTFWSYDWRHRYAVRDREVGLIGLRERIVKRFAPYSITILIIDKESDSIIEKYVRGVKVD